MLGAIAGDIAGSRFEFHNRKSKDFRLFTEACHVTDDSIMTVAIAAAVLSAKTEGKDLGAEAVRQMRRLGRRYPFAGYGGRFRRWLQLYEPIPYDSYGNGAAMRVSACGWAAESVEEAAMLSRAVTMFTHNHPESFKAAEAISVAIFMARTGSSLEEIRTCIRTNYYPEEFTLDSIREAYTFEVSCQGSVPQAFEAFFESNDFEDTIRNAVSIGGDSDTIAAMAGSIAEAYYGIPDSIRKKAMDYLDRSLLDTVLAFEETFGC